MEPVPETRDALRWMTTPGEARAADELTVLAERATTIVPDLAAFSINVVHRSITLTYVATDRDSALLDGLQYVDDGPCEEASRTGQRVAVDHAELLDEQRWQLFAQAGAARGIHSTLSLPVLHDGEVVGGINLYGRRSNTFLGLHDELAEVFGAWAPGAVANADLSFSTRLEAARAPRRLEDERTVDTAIDKLAATNAVSHDTAERKLHEAAARADIPVVALALMVIGEDAGD